MCTALVALVGSVAAFAQDNAPAHKTVFQKDGASSHWFIELGNSASIALGGSNSEAKFADRISYINPSLSVGRWHNPYFATRLQLQGGELFDYNSSIKFNRYYGVGHLDFMFDVVNYFSSYKERRFFHIIPFVGVGAGWRGESEWTVAGQTFKGNDDRLTATAHAGLQLKFRLAKRVDLNLEGQVIANDFRLPSYAATTGGVRGGVISTAGASLTFHLGKKEFTPVVPEDAELIASLNDRLNTLRAENAELRKRPTHCPEAIALAPVAGVAVGNVVYFRINSDKVDANQLININSIAEYAKNNTETITLAGYADRETGTPEYNYELSQRRAEAVKKILVEKHGISADRIKTSWHGDRVQPYAENVWNRIVIMSAE